MRKRVEKIAIEEIDDLEEDNEESDYEESDYYDDDDDDENSNDSDYPRTQKFDEVESIPLIERLQQKDLQEKGLSSSNQPSSKRLFQRKRQHDAFERKKQNVENHIEKSLKRLKKLIRLNNGIYDFRLDIFFQSKIQNLKLILSLPKFFLTLFGVRYLLFSQLMK